MIEIPEAQTIAAQLRTVMEGRSAVSLTRGASPHKFAFFNDDAPLSYEEMLLGKPFQAIQAAGGHVEIDNADARLLFGDGVNIRYYPPEREAPAKHQFLMELDDGASLVCTISMYGIIWATLHGMEENFYNIVPHEKPSPLEEAFDAAYFESIRAEAKPSLSAKGLLATEQRIPGLGNGCLQDILFLAGIHPKRKISSLSDGEMDTLFHSVKNTLREMTEKGGRDTEKDVYGNSGGYQSLSAKTAKNPCPVCGDSIIRQAYMGGNVYFCETCQRL